MVTNLTLSNLEDVKIGNKIVAFRGEKHVYILATGQKNGTMFVPLAHGADYRYKGKNAKASVKAAVQNDEQVLVCDTADDLFRHCLSK